MPATTLNTKQEAKVVAFVAAAREAKSNGKLTGEAKHDNATILRIANTHKQNAWVAKGSKGLFCPWLCIPGFAQSAVLAGIGAQAVRKVSAKSSGAQAPSLHARNHKDTCTCIICTRIQNAHKADVATPATPTTVTVASLSARVDSLDSKLDAILAKLA